MKNKQIWQIAGLTRQEYVKLSWPRKRNILLKYFGQPDEVQFNDEELPADLRNHPLGHLLWAYRKFKADSETIKRHYPNLGMQ